MEKYDYKEIQKRMKECCQWYKFNDQLVKSVPKKVNKFKLVSNIKPSCGDWEFKIQTEFDICFIWHSECLSTMNFLWSFIDALASGEKEAYWDCDQEGTDAVLIAQEIDDKNIRLSLFSNGWYNFYKKEWNTFRKKEILDIPLKLDVIINKDKFISTVYAELIDGFSYGNKYYWNNVLWNSQRTNSNIVISYFSRKCRNEFNIELSDLLSKDIKEIKKYLKDGFNPNYLEFYKKTYLNGATTPLTILSSGYDNIYEEMPELNFYYKEQIKKLEKNIDKIKLFLEYGAMPNFFSTVHQWDYTPLETAVCTYSIPKTIEVLLQNGAKDTKLCWEMIDKYKVYVFKNYDGKKYFKEVIDLFEKYGERTIFDKDYSSK